MMSEQFELGQKPPMFKVGDFVDCERWDKTESQKRRLGVRVVEDIRRDNACESGWSALLNGAGFYLDQGWLKPWNPKTLSFEI